MPFIGREQEKTEIQRYIATERQRDRKTYTQTERVSDRQSKSHIPGKERQIYQEQRDRETGGQTGRQTETDRDK